jgi:hypothetical protein
VVLKLWLRLWVAASVMASSKQILHEKDAWKNDQFKFSLNETVSIRRKVSSNLTGGPFQSSSIGHPFFKKMVNFYLGSMSHHILW